MIPDLTPIIKPLVTRFPGAWAKAQKPHDDGEFNARVCAVLHYEHGYTQVGRNGKRGDPRVLSKDVICWRGEGPNYDPTNGNAPVTILDFIASHEAPNAHITQFAPDPNGPGAWVQPQTLEQIDAGRSPGPAPAPVPALKSRDQFAAEFVSVNAFYSSREGLQRVGGMVAGVDASVFAVLRGVADGSVLDYLAIRNACSQVLSLQCDAQSMIAWGYALMVGATPEQVIAQIRQSDEWKAKHSGEQP